MRTLIAALAASCLAMAAEHGFEPIFDGESLNGWSLLARKDATGSWQVRDGTLTVQGRPGSLGTLADYGDFELRLEWMVGPQGNSGVFYRFEGTGNPAEVAIEYQIADNARPASQKFAVRKAGAAYGLYASCLCYPVGVRLAWSSEPSFPSGGSLVPAPPAFFCAISRRTGSLRLARFTI